MKIKARLTFLINQEGVNIELMDDNSNVTFLELNLTPEQWCKVGSRLAHTPVDAFVFNLDKIGKVKETQSFEFPFSSGKHSWGKERNEVAIKAGKKVCPKGWELDCYFGSQGSFFEKNGKQWARTHIKRWVDKGVENDGQTKN